METETQTTTGNLTAKVRSRTGKGVARKLRATGLIPAVVYGGTDGESIPVTVDPEALKKALDTPTHRNTVIDLTIEDDGKSQQVKVMLKDYQVDTLKQTVLHADFIRVAMDRLVDVRVPLTLLGRPEGVKIGGNLHQIFRTLPVRCLPSNIPADISIDVSALELNESKQVQDLELPQDITIGLPGNQTIALVMAPKRIAELEEEAGAEGEAVEGEAAEGEAKEGDKEDAGKDAGKPSKG